MHKTRQSDTWTSSQTSQGHTGRKAVHIHSQTKTNTDLLSADGGGRTRVWWHVAADGSLPPLPPLFLLFLCHLWRRKHFLRHRRPPPNPGCRSFITRGTGHLQLKFICFRLQLTLASCTSLPVRRNESESHSDTDGSCEQTFCKIYFKHFPLITQNVLFTDVNVCVSSSVRQSVMGTTRLCRDHVGGDMVQMRTIFTEGLIKI